MGLDLLTYEMVIISHLLVVTVKSAWKVAGADRWTVTVVLPTVAANTVSFHLLTLGKAGRPWVLSGQPCSRLAPGLLWETDLSGQCITVSWGERRVRCAGPLPPQTPWEHGDGP